MLPLAHAGHYAIWVLYVIPVLVVVGAIARSAILTRRTGTDEAASPTSEFPGADRNE